MVQLTARYLSYASLFLTILFALGSSSVLEEHVTGRKKLALSCSLAVFMALFSLSSLSVYRDTLKHVQDMPKTSANSTQPAPFKRLRDYNYYNQFNYKILFGAFDYMPKSSLTSVQKRNSLLMHQAYLNGKTLTLSPLIKANQISYQVKSEKAADVDLPVIAYKHTTVSVNGQKHAFLPPRQPGDGCSRPQARAKHRHGRLQGQSCLLLEHSHQHPQLARPAYLLGQVQGQICTIEKHRKKEYVENHVLFLYSRLVIMIVPLFEPPVDSLATVETGTQAIAP